MQNLGGFHIFSKFKIMFVCMCLLLVCSIGAINAADSNMTDMQTVGKYDVISSTLDGEELVASNIKSSNSSYELGVCGEDKLSAGTASFSDLNNEIMKGSGTIVLDKDYVYNNQFDSVYADGFVIDKSITIDFSGHSFDGDNKLVTILKVNADNVVLKNVKIKNGNGTADVVCPIIWNGNSGTMDNVEISNFRRGITWYGSNGAILNSVIKDSFYFRLNVQAPNFLMNNTRMYNINNSFSGINVQLMALRSTGGKITYSRFENCHAYSGILLDSGSSQGAVMNCVFYNMTATRSGYAGAGIYILGVNYDIFNCYFEKCQGLAGNAETGETRGGALYVGAAGINAHVKNCTFYDNKGHLGGALIINNPAGLVENCTFIKNTALASSKGGAVYLNGGTLTNCYFEENTAKYGAAIYVSASTVIRNITCVRNVASEDGGAIYIDGESGVVENSVFRNNRAKNGGGVYVNKNKGSITYCNFYSNTVSVSGSAIYILQNGEAHLANNYYSGGNSEVYAVGRTDSSYSKLYISPSGTGSGTSSSSPTNWANALNHILSYGEIIFTAGTYTNIVASEINSPVTLTAQGNVIINNNHANYVFRLNTAYVNIRGITFQNNGATTSSCGAIYINGYFANITNCKFTSNYGTTAGAIQDVGGMSAKNHFIDSCTFTSNVCYGNSTSYAGAVYLGATNSIISNCVFNSNKQNNGIGCSALTVYSSDNYFTKVLNCNFTSNTASNGVRGALNVVDCYGVTLDNLRFVSNSAKSIGAINWIPQSSSLHISKMNNMHFENNKATNGYAGAVYWKCSYGTMSNVVFKGNTATSNAGGLYWNSTRGTLINGSFINNVGLVGGAIYWYGSYGALDNLTFKNNNATSYAGAVYVGHIFVSVKNCNFESNNVRSGYGGALCWASANGTLSYSNFTRNTASTYGGAICWWGAEGILTNLILRNNEAKGSYSGALKLNANKIEVYNSLFENNKAKTTGGAINVYGAENIINNCVFNNNLATTIGGAINVTGNNSEITNCNFTGNKANGGYGGAVFVKSQLAIYLDDNIQFGVISAGNNDFYTVGIIPTYAIIYITPNGNGNGSFNNPTNWNDALVHIAPRGKIFFKDGTYVLSEQTLSKKFIKLIGLNKGGAIINANRAGRVFTVTGKGIEIYNLTFINGYLGTSNNGSAILWKGDNGIISDCAFNNNEVNHNTGYGTVYISPNSKVLITKSSFTNNKAKKLAGGIYIAGSNSNVSFCVFDKNIAYDSGSSIILNAKNVLIFNNTFKNEITTGSDKGGALALYGGSNNIIRNNSFINNTASTGMGGAIIFLNSNSNLLIEGNRFEDNRASTSGGAIATYGTVIILNLNNNIFINNSATNGGAVSFTTSGSSSFMLNGNNFTKNRATTNGGAIYNVVTDIVIKNSNFTKNVAGNFGGGIYTTKSISVSTSQFNQNEAVKGSAIYLVGSNSITLDTLKFTANTASNSGTVFLENNVKVYNNDLKFKDNIKPGLDVVTSTTYYASTLFVSLTGTGSGIHEDEPTTLNTAMAKILDKGKIIFLSGNYDISKSFNAFNVTFVGRVGAVLTGSKSDKLFDIVKSNIKFVNLTFADLRYSGSTVASCINIQSGNVEFDNCTFVNVGENLGSVINYNSGSSGKVANSKFTNNNINGNYILSISGNVDIDNNLFENNTASIGAVGYIGSYKGSITNSVFKNNTGSTSNLYVNPSIINDVVIKNNTFTTIITIDDIGNAQYNSTVVIKGKFDDGTNRQGIFNVSLFNNTYFIANVTTNADKKYSYSWTKMAVGNYTIVLGNNDGSNEFDFIYLNKSFSIYKANSSMIIQPINNITYSANTTIEFAISNRTENVSYIIVNRENGLNITCNNISGNIISLKLAAGNYTITITNNENVNYNETSKSMNFTVYNALSSVNTTSKVIVYGNEININLTALNASSIVWEILKGNVKVANGTATVNNNTAGFNLDLPAGNYTIVLTTVVDVNHTSVTNSSASLNVTKYTPKINVTVVDVVYPGVVKVNVTSDVNGTYVLSIGGKTNSTELVAGVSKIVTISGLAANETGYNVNVTYGETENYTAAFNDTKSVKVFKANSTVNGTSLVVVYGNDIVVNVTAFNASSVKWAIMRGSIQIANGTAIVTNNITDFSVDLPVGNYTIVLTTVVDVNHTSVTNSSASLNVTKYTPKINVTVVDVVYPGVVKVNVTSDVNGTYVLSIGGKTNSTELVAGVSKIVTISGLAANETGYNVNVTYGETENYTAAFNDTKSVKVFKANSTVNGTSLVVVYGNDIVVNVTAFNASSVKWAIMRGSIQVANGTAIVANNMTDFAVDLAVGNYTIVLTTVVDANHTSVTNSSTSLNVTKYTPKINVTVVDVVYGDAIRVNITGDINGTYVLSIGGKTNSTELVAGVSKIVTISGLAANETGYNVNVTYGETENYTAAFNDTKSVKVFKANSTVNGTSLVVVYGNDIVVNVTAFNASSVKWAIMRGSIQVANGTAIVANNMTDFAVDLAVGNYTIVLTTVVDANHTSVTNSSTSLNVTKYTPKINVTVVDVVYGDAIRVNITGDINGTYVLSIGGKTNSTELVAGVSKIVTISGLAANETGYNVNVTYGETENYTAAFNDTKSVKVFKANSTVNGTSLVVVYGNDIVVNVTAFNASSVKWAIMRGSIQVANGTAIVANNMTDFAVDLAVGNYTIVLTTVVDANHTSVTNSSASLNVTKYTPKIKVVVVDVTYPNAIRVNVTSDVSGTYTIDINGVLNTTELTADVSKIIEFNNFAVNETGYNVNVTYVETENYTAAFNDTKFVKVFRANSTVNGTSLVIVYGNIIVVNVTAFNASDVKWAVMNGSIEIVNGTAVVTNNATTIDNLDLAVGNYTIVLTTVVDANHTVAVNTLSLNITKYSPKINVAVVDVVYPGIVSVDITSDVDGTYVLTIGGKSNSTELVAGITKTLTISDLAANEEGYSVNVTYGETQNYTSAFNDTKIVKVFKANSTVNATSMVIVYGSEIIVNVSAFNASSILWEILKDNVKVVNGTAAVSNNATTIGNLDLAVGNYTIVLTTVVDGNHSVDINRLTTLNITKYTPKINVSVENVQYPNVVYVTVVSDVDGIYTVQIGDKSQSDELFAGIAKIIPIMNLNASEFGYVVNVTYGETQNYTSAFNDTSIVNVFKAPSSVNATSMVVVYGDEFIINITAVNATGISWEIMNGTTKVIDGISQVIDGKANISNIKLPAGNYTVVLTTQVDSNHNYAVDNKTTLNITQKASKIQPTINTHQMVYGMNLNVTVTLAEDATGFVNITAGDESYVKQLVNGTVDFDIPGLNPGEHNLTIAYLGDNNYQNSTTSILVKVSNKLSYTHVSVKDIFRGENVTITVTVPDDATGNVTIEVANITYNVTISNGNATLIIANLTPEIYSINATYLGDEYYTDSFNDTVSFKVKTDKTVIADEMIRGYNSGIDYQVKFTDDIDKPLANIEVVLTIDGKPYHLITDENGVASLNITVPIGTHTIVAINPVTGEEAHSTFTIVSRLKGVEKMVMDFKDGSYYVVRAIGEDGNPVGENVTVEIAVNGVVYKVKTDSKGYAKLAINLNPNKFKVISKYAGLKITDTLIVKQTLSAKKVQTVKKSAKTTKVKATLKWSSGKAIAGKPVTMKFRGKIYKAKTNGKGIATFKLPKKSVKKLKVGKKYRVKFTYLTNSIYKYLKIAK